MARTVKLALLGLGTVGKSLLEIIKQKHDFVAKRYGIEFIVKGIFEFDGALVPSGADEPIDIVPITAGVNIREMRGWQPGIVAVDRIVELDVDAIIEMTPTNVETGEPAVSHIKLALQSGKHVVSSNKGPFLLKYNEIMSLAKEKKLKVRFEATVGSCIPVLQTARTSLHGNIVTGIEAILNGTSNYILTRMANEQISFDLALKEAQQRGYAEADPTLDIGGHDAAGKLVILANSLMGMEKTISDVKVEGITHINLDAITFAQSEGFVIKHLGIADADGNLQVGPKLVPKSSPLGAGVTGTLNAVKLDTDLSREIILIGRGAGGIEAASAIYSDLIDMFIRFAKENPPP